MKHNQSISLLNFKQTSNSYCFSWLNVYILMKREFIKWWSTILIAKHTYYVFQSSMEYILMWSQSFVALLFSMLFDFPRGTLFLLPQAQVNLNFKKRFPIYPKLGLSLVSFCSNYLGFLPTQHQISIKCKTKNTTPS